MGISKKSDLPDIAHSTAVLHQHFSLSLYPLSLSSLPHRNTHTHTHTHTHTLSLSLSLGHPFTQSFPVVVTPSLLTMSLMSPLPSLHRMGQDGAGGRLAEQRKYGIYFDDEYDYMQHLRDRGEGHLVMEGGASADAADMDLFAGASGEAIEGGGLSGNSFCLFFFFCSCVRTRARARVCVCVCHLFPM